MPALSRPRSPVLGMRAYREQDVRAVDFGVAGVAGHVNVGACLPAAGGLEGDALALRRMWMPSASRISLMGCGDVFILMLDQARTFFDYGDFAAEAAIHLCEFRGRYSCRLRLLSARAALRG